MTQAVFAFGSQQHRNANMCWPCTSNPVLLFIPMTANTLAIARATHAADTLPSGNKVFLLQTAARALCTAYARGVSVPMQFTRNSMTSTQGALCFSHCKVQVSWDRLASINSSHCSTWLACHPQTLHRCCCCNVSHTYQTLHRCCRFNVSAVHQHLTPNFKTLTSLTNRGPL